MDTHVVQLEPTDKEPYVLLDSNSCRIEIKGVSLPISAYEFYHPVVQWLDQFYLTKPSRFDVLFDFEFFDTQSAKMILEILRKTKEL